VIHINESLRPLIQRRYSSLNKRCVNLGIEKPHPGTLENLFDLATKTGFRCYYCHDDLEPGGTCPYRKSPSVDHKTPLTSGGSNELENLVLCCHECNIIKGTLDDADFFRLLSLLIQDQGLKRRLFEKWFNYGLANKIERLGLENRRN
jgi:5-methylcytosine-specific restriction endonuclease McrA